MTLRFDGRVAIVTGAGRGIGRAHARLLAARGAAVLVNDLGTTMTGDGADTNVAATLTTEITAGGGVAEADSSDVSSPDGAAALAQHALDAFGRIDIVVNNAGIYGLDTFPDLTWDRVRRLLDVHVGGSFNVSRECWPHLVAAGSGRIVMTTSTAALGRFDLVGYGTAKAAVLGLARALATVGEPLGIKVNAVAPMAMTRMMGFHQNYQGAEPPPDPLRDPELVSPLVAVLCHGTCPVNGEAFVAGQRRHSRLVLAETEGFISPGLDLDPETVQAAWGEIVDERSLTVRPDTMSWSSNNTAQIEAAPVPPHVADSLRNTSGE